MNITEKQMEAFNKKDLKTFLAYYTDDYHAYMLESGQMITKDKNQLSEIMSDLFSKTNNTKSRIVESMTQGDLIINKEESLGHIEGKVINSITIYEIKDDKICKMWFGGRTIH